MKTYLYTIALLYFANLNFCYGGETPKTAEKKRAFTIKNEAIQCSLKFMAKVRDTYKKNRADLGLKDKNLSKETEPLARLQKVADHSEEMQQNVLDLISQVEHSVHRSFLIKLIFKHRDGKIDRITGS